MGRSLFGKRSKTIKEEPVAPRVITLDERWKAMHKAADSLGGLLDVLDHNDASDRGIGKIIADASIVITQRLVMETNLAAKARSEGAEPPVENARMAPTTAPAQ